MLPLDHGGTQLYLNKILWLCLLFQESMLSYMYSTITSAKPISTTSQCLRLDKFKASINACNLCRAWLHLSESPLKINVFRFLVYILVCAKHLQENVLVFFCMLRWYIHTYILSMMTSSKCMHTMFVWCLYDFWSWFRIERFLPNPNLHLDINNTLSTRSSSQIVTITRESISIV